MLACCDDNRYVAASDDSKGLRIWDTTTTPKWDELDLQEVFGRMMQNCKKSCLNKLYEASLLAYLSAEFDCTLSEHMTIMS